MNRKVLNLLCFALILASGCTVKTPEVSFTSERTALEKQILGAYQTIEEDAWMVSSVRGAEAQEITVPESKRRVLEAFANRKFNADDVEDFKTAGVVGENTSGLLTIIPTARYDEDPDYRRLVDQIVAEENSDREIIMTRIVEVNSGVNPLDREAVVRVFAQMTQDTSPRGTLIQKEDGRWVKK